jgi:ABC-type multidrug transport system ATPase subunit
MQSYSSAQDPDVAEEQRRVEAGVYTAEPLVVSNLRKEFPSRKSSSIRGAPHVAVDDICFGVAHGECFGLLGSNGAGKTTTVRMLEGELKPTRGTALVAGHSVLEDVGRVQLEIGVCPQFSILWDDLTCQEHLLFYARLKGVPDVHQRTAACLKDFGLWEFRSRQAKALSGGMRRRLSVAISLVGDSTIVFLDEPTTGLDPHSRRQLWRVIRGARAGRAVVLTTHSMEEAETLCSRIAIMAHGRLCCIGSPVHLKNRHTDGYRLLVNYPEDCSARATAAITGLFPDAKPVSAFAGTSEWRVRVSAADVPPLFQRMEQSAEAAGITDWSLAQLGLSDVFQTVVEATQC